VALQSRDCPTDGWSGYGLGNGLKYQTLKGVAEWLMVRLGIDQHDRFSMAAWLSRADHSDRRHEQRRPPQARGHRADRHNLRWPIPVRHSSHTYKLFYMASELSH
jgi:hypothetical protein